MVRAVQFDQSWTLFPKRPGGGLTFWNQTDNLSGVYVIVPTPFHQYLILDHEGLLQIVHFCVDCGAHGLVAPANASEQPYLSDVERRAVTRTVIEEGRGKAVVVAGVTAWCRRPARRRIGARRPRRGRWARTCASDGHEPPKTCQRGTEAEIKEYYAASPIDVAGKLRCQIFLQNYGGAGGAPTCRRV